MHTTFVIAVFLICECLTIRVPVVWDDGVTSEVQNENQKQKDEFSVETFQPKEETTAKIPTEYFEYTAKKPQFAINIAKHHGVKNPIQHFKAHAVRPYTGKGKPQLGIHHMLDEDRKVFNPYQQYVNTEAPHHVTPVLNNYEVFHPYKAEEPALQEIYKDPVLNKIKNDLENSKNRLQKYENEAGELNITREEYLEGELQTDKKLFPQKNVPATFEIHRPQRRPVYYRPPPKFNHRDQVLNQIYRHPWNQNFVKIRPVHYRPLKNHIHNLRQHHAMKYDDEKNEYPQIQVSQDFAEPQDGFDIYEKGKEKYEQLRDNVDESINKAVLENRPQTYQKLEIQNNERGEKNEDNEFIPIKNYAQVRKTETFQHVPRAAAFADAENYEELRNAPRLREAVKSTKAQTVYSEEGYEDSAYDHAGEQKHASDHEGHGGYLKEKEISGGKYKIPSVSDSYDDGRGSEYRDQVLHGKKWKNNIKDKEQESEAQEYSEIEQEQDIDADTYVDNSDDENGLRSKRENYVMTASRGKNLNDQSNNTISKVSDIGTENSTALGNELQKREINFKVPEIDLNSTFLTDEDITKLAKIKIEPKKDDIKEKYPYYFKNFKHLESISMHSPLKYAENLKLIPKKSKGGTEFYDSRSQFECPEVDDVDPLPEKLKNGENPTESNEEEDEETKPNEGEKKFDAIKDQPRLKGLGDKIDCLKAKYFGENPLDSPFFKEDVIANPEPVSVPNLSTYKLKATNGQAIQETTNIVNIAEKLGQESNDDIFSLIEKLRNGQENLRGSINKTNEELRQPLQTKNISYKKPELDHQSKFYIDDLYNTKNHTWNTPEYSEKNISVVLNTKQNIPNGNITYNFIKNLNKEDITKKPLKLRKKRAATFTYEPYKIIRDSQVQDSKKTITTRNVGPLIKQLQSSRVVDKVSKDNEFEKPVKSYVSTRTYKDIGKNDRPENLPSEDSTEPSFIDVSVDQRRGEPRYEIIPVNHKPEYTPVENKKAMSREDYETQTNTENNLKSSSVENKEKTIQTQIRRSSRQRKPTLKSVFDVSQYIPTSTNGENVAASNNVRRIVTSTTTTVAPKVAKARQLEESEEDNNSEEDYDEYDGDDEEISSTTTTTTVKPTFRRKTRGTTTTTELPHKETTEVPKLRLVTRFRDYNANKSTKSKEIHVDKPKLQSKESYPNDEDIEVIVPKYREKKKKTTKSTLVTDTKKYGDGDNDMRKEEVDALIGVQQDMQDYMPMYEKENENKEQSNNDSSEESDEEFDSDEDYDEEEDNNDGSDEEKDEDEPEVTTPEPTKRTLVRTTDAPVPTIASRSTKLEFKPVVSKRKIEIHKEIPTNKSSPHITQFKQDIKEVEIIKEIPQRKKSQKNMEALELYKDDGLAKEINKLSDVEVFKENLDLTNGPKHGGNYRSVEEITESPVETITAKDAVASQSKNTKHIELEEYTLKKMHGGNLKSVGDVQRPRNTGRNAKYTEYSDSNNSPKAMQGGNLKYDTKSRRGHSRTEKLIELDDKDNDRSKESDDDNYFKAYGSRTGPMHGGNYRSAKLVSDDDIQINKEGRDASRNAAVLLNSFAQAVPILTTTPGYILDPSKRMYYYVET